MFSVLLKDQGIKVTFVDALKLDEVRAAITDKTRFVYAETVGNPALDVVDVAGLAKAAHERNIPLVIDATFTLPSITGPSTTGRTS
jgi:O-acetylhomoserine (thiol)-lyase